jgi:hypothetical protein
MSGQTHEKISGWIHCRVTGMDNDPHPEFSRGEIQFEPVYFPDFFISISFAVLRLSA